MDRLLPRGKRTERGVTESTRDEVPTLKSKEGGRRYDRRLRCTPSPDKEQGLRTREHMIKKLNYSYERGLYRPYKSSKNLVKHKDRN